jgi:recombination associated protein RdgC
MATNPYKAFVPCLVTPSKPAGPLEDYAVTDPSAGDWRRVGLAPAFPGEDFIVDLQGAAKIMAIQFNERILPGKVRDEQLAKEVAKVEQRDGRKISKKEYAQLREQVEFDLLPKAFIRRTVVPIIFIRYDVGQQFMLICTSSAKRADDCAELLQGVFPELRPTSLTVQSDVSSRLRTLAVAGFLLDDSERETGFFSHDSIALKGNEKKAIRVKDKPVDDGDVQTLLKNTEYNVIEMGVGYSNKPHEDGFDLTFVVNEHLIFKRIVTEGVKASLIKEDLYAYTVMCAGLYKQMLLRFIEAFGGIAGASNEDDEL